MTLLAVEQLEAWYGRAQVLFGVSLEVNAGEVAVLLGRDGAGKSTTLKAIMGLGVTRRGRILFEGHALETLATHRIARLGLAYVPEDRRIFTSLTVEENLAIARLPARYGDGWSRERIFELFPSLAEMRTRLGGRMSGGEQQMLTIARALMGNPRFLLLDEPSEGLAPIVVEAIVRAVRELKRAGVGLLVSEQSLQVAGEIADRAYVIAGGQLRFSGTLQELEADPAVSERYLAV